MLQEKQKASGEKQRKEMISDYLRSSLNSVFMNVFNAHEMALERAAKLVALDILMEVNTKPKKYSIN